MVTKLLSSIDERYPLAEVDAGELKQVKAMGMTFSIRAFRSAGLGDETKAHTANLPDHQMNANWYDSIKLPQSFSKKSRRG